MPLYYLKTLHHACSGKPSLLGLTVSEDTKTDLGHSSSRANNTKNWNKSILVQDAVVESFHHINQLFIKWLRDMLAGSDVEEHIIQF